MPKHQWLGEEECPNIGGQWEEKSPNINYQWGGCIGIGFYWEKKYPNVRIASEDNARMQVLQHVAEGLGSWLAFCVYMHVSVNMLCICIGTQIRLPNFTISTRRSI